ncbi:MAG: TSUP family transporter, partial [Hyphomicrobiaceae bacterium]
MDDLAIFLGVLAPVSLIAGFIRGFTGLGGPLILVPTLSLFIPPPAAAWVVNWVDVIANIKLLPDTRAHVSRSIVLPLMVGSVFTIPLGVYLLVSIDATIMRRTICAAILVAAHILAAGWRYRGPTGTLDWVAVGAFSGFILGATSIALTAALFLHAGQQRAAESRAN